MIFWEYQVEDHRRSEFEEAYGAGGDWARLFRNASGYLGSRLLHDVGDARAYLTIDTWADRDAFEAFMAHWGGIVSGSGSTAPRSHLQTTEAR